MRPLQCCEAHEIVKKIGVPSRRLPFFHTRQEPITTTFYIFSDRAISSAFAPWTAVRCPSVPPLCLPVTKLSSFCVAQERPGCHYGVRLLSGPRAGSASKRPTKEEPVPGKAANANCAPSTRSGDGSGGSSGLVSLRRYSSVLPLKR